MFRWLAAGAGVWGLASGLPCCRLLSSSPPAGASARHRPGSATGRALLRPAALGVTARRAPPQRPAPAFCRFCARHGIARAASRRPFTGTRMAESAGAMTPDAASERNQLLLGSLPRTYRPSGQTRSQRAPPCGALTSNISPPQPDTQAHQSRNTTSTCPRSKPHGPSALSRVERHRLRLTRDLARMIRPRQVWWSEVGRGATDAPISS